METSQNNLFGMPEKLAEISENLLFGDIWLRPELSPRDRSMITVAALIAMNRKEQLPFHIERAFQNGVTHEELNEIITHMAFYSGWPTAASASKILADTTAK